jgi:hypothetical protein
VSRILFALAADVSGSMGRPIAAGGRTPLDLLNDELGKLVDFLKNDRALRPKVELMVSGFALTARPVRPFATVKDDPSPPHLRPDPEPDPKLRATNLAEGVHSVLNELAERHAYCRGRGDVVDWLYFALLTDARSSRPLDRLLPTAAKRLKLVFDDMASNPASAKLVPVVVGIGPDVGPDLGHFDAPLVGRLKEWDFGSLFGPVKRSLSAGVASRPAEFDGRKIFTELVPAVGRVGDL